MRIRILHPESRVIEAQSKDDLIAELNEWLGTFDGVTSNTVFSIGGETAGATGTSESVSNPIDRVVLVALRRASDVVVTGGNTARAEGYKKPRSARLAIVTSTGALEQVPAIRDENGEPVIVFTGEIGLKRLEAPASQGQVELHRLLGLQNDPTGHQEALASLAELGYHRILVESGSNIIKELANAGVIRNLCLVLTKENYESFSIRKLDLRWLGFDSTKFKLAGLASAENTVITLWRAK